MVLTREALALAVAGQPKTNFIRVVSRLAEAGVDVSAVVIAVVVRGDGEG